MQKDLFGEEKPYHIVALSITSKEFKTVKDKVMQTAYGAINEILTISRIQNPQLYMSYIIRKQAMDKANKSTNNERSLFHGTLEESCVAINHHGFNRSYAGKNGKNQILLLSSAQPSSRPLLFKYIDYIEKYSKIERHSWFRNIKT